MVARLLKMRSKLFAISIFCLIAAPIAQAQECPNIQSSHWSVVRPGWGTSGTFNPVGGRAPLNFLRATLRDLAGVMRNYHPAIYNGTISNYDVTPHDVSERPTITFHLFKRIFAFSTINSDFQAQVYSCMNPPGRTPSTCRGPRIVLDTRSTTGSFSGMVDAIVVDFCLQNSPARPNALDYQTVTWIAEGPNFDRRANWFFENQSALIRDAVEHTYNSNAELLMRVRAH